MVARRTRTDPNAGQGPVAVERATSTAPAVTTEAAPTLPPPRRRRQPRMQLNTRIPGELYERLQSFIDQHDVAVQDVVEGALTEYLDRRS